MRPNNSLVVSNLSTGTASFVSSAFWIQDVVRASFQVTLASGSFTGAFTIQASNDQPVGKFPNQYEPTNWNTLGSVTVVCSSGAATGTTFLIQGVETCYEYGRVQYTAANGGVAQGSANVRMKILGI